MVVLDVMTDAYLLATGKLPLPLASSSKYNTLFRLTQKFYRDWQTEPDVDWDSLYSVTGAGTISTDTEYDFDEEIISISQRDGDFVRVLLDDGQYVNFKLVSASQLRMYPNDNYVAKVGQTLKFSRTFTSTDKEFGKEIEVPAFLKLEELTSVNDDVLIDNPAWLSAVVAAQYVQPDAQLSYQYPDLLAQAQDLMKGMKQANQSGSESYNTGYNYFDNGNNIC